MPSNPLDNIVAPQTSQRPPQESDCGCETDDDTAKIAKKHTRNEIERERKEAEEGIADSQQNRAQRKEYAGKIFWLVCAWLAVLTVLVGATGATWLALSDTVLVALISGASVNIIGLMVIVASYLFPKSGNHKQDSEKRK